MHIREFQDMMRRIYFHHDSSRGTIGTYKWLVDEVEELGATVTGQNHQAMVDEFADVLAWLASLANVVGIDLENATTSKYPGKCPKCRETPCKCSL